MSLCIWEQQGGQSWAYMASPRLVEIFLVVGRGKTIVGGDNALWSSTCDGLVFGPMVKSTFPPFASTEKNGGGRVSVCMHVNVSYYPDVLNAQWWVRS